MKIISLGWGVQSFTMAAMSALGELEKVDFAIHADTTHERTTTYDFAARWKPWLEERGVRVVTTRNDKPLMKLLKDGTHSISIPAVTLSIKGDIGRTQRRCTFDWKIANIRRWEQSNRNKQPVEQWIGISLDEFQRMRDSDVKYITNRWPLIEKKMTRVDCENYLLSHGMEVPKKSACVFCPYSDTRSWQAMKSEGGQDWQEAIKIDNEIRKVRRNARIPIDLFIHPSCKPLDEVDFRTQEEKGQLSLWDNECSGICGV
jgi:hypothetical protein